MIKGRILMYFGFALAGAVGGLVAKYTCHRLSWNGFAVVVAGIATALGAFLAYTYVFTKTGK